MHLPTTFWLIMGSSEYRYFADHGLTQDLPGVEGATADCLGMRQDLLAFGYPDSQVISFCGQELLKGQIVATVNSLATRLSPGDTLVVFWVGHGGGDLSDPGQKLWQPYDGAFVSEDDGGDGYGMTGIDPRLFESALRRNVPFDTEVVFLTDTAREDVYRGWLSLQGPTFKDFAGLNPHTWAVTPGHGEPGALRRLLNGCLGRNLAMAEDARITVMEAGTCFGALSDKAPSEWTSLSTSLIWYPPAPKVATLPPPDPVQPRKSSLRPVFRFGGLGIGVGSAIAGGVTFAQANAIYADAESQNFLVEESMRPDIERYDDLRVATYALWGASVLGLASFGGSYLTLTPTPQGLAISGSF